MNISYIRDGMLDFLDSPVPYLLGMGDNLWEAQGQKKWQECCKNSDDIVVVRLDGELPMIMTAPDSETESLVKNDTALM